VCILQGPVAAKWSVKKDEPVKELLGSINEALIQRLLERKYGGDPSRVPTAAYLAPLPKSIPAELPGVVRTETEISVVYEFSSQLPDTSEWLETLSGRELTWLHALVTSKTIVQGTSYVDNPLRRVLAPRRGQKFVVRLKCSQPSVTVYGAARSYGEHLPGFKALEIIFSPKTSVINVTIFEERRGSCIPLTLQFRYHPKQGFAPIHEISAARNNRIKQFYWSLWYGDNEVLPEIDIREKFVGPEITISADDIERFCAVVGNSDESFQTARNGQVQAPMDFAIVTGWQVCLAVNSLLMIH
jgi:fatty acid synthase subunit alpha